MKRFFATLCLAAVLGAALGCSQFRDTDTSVTMTKAESLVAGCQKVGDVAVDPKTSDAKLSSALAEEARSKGANYLLVPSDGAHNGTAYKCGTPKTASR
jgi:hypothetical protein